MTVAATTLSAAIANASVTTASVRDVVGFASSADADDLVLVDSEYMLVGAGMGTTSWSSITRGYGGSTAAAHLDGATVYRILRGYTNLLRVKTHLKVTNATDDSFILDCVEGANAWLTGEVGRFYGPSTDASRTYDVARTGDKTVMIGGGLRSVTTLKARSVEGGTLATVTSTDYVLRPSAENLLPGLAYDRIELITSPASILHFTAGRDMVEVTSSTFGPAEPPAALTKIADTIAVWMFQSRASGAGGVIGSNEFGDMVVNRVLTGADIRTIRLYRGVGPSMYAYPAF